MLAEIISIGDELTSGQRLDTNSQWLSQQLGDLGIRVLYHTTVGDELAANVRVFREAVERADVILCTGGLGPTADDLTRDALAEMIGKPLVRDENSLAHIKALFARRNREMPPRNEVQAMFPEGSQPIFNPHGSAPGIDLSVERPHRAPARIFCLPGVPAEMKEMWEQSVCQALRQLVGSPRVIHHHRIKCFGVGESDLEQMLPDLIRRGRDPIVGITVHEATITLRISAEGDSANECMEKMNETIRTIHGCLGNLVFGTEEEELEHAVVRLLRQRGLTLSTMEWGTSGWIASHVGSAQDSAGIYLGGITIADSAAAARAIARSNSPAEGIHQDQAQLVRGMARACRDYFGTDIGLAVGPFPPPAAPGEAPGRLHYAVATGQAVEHSTLVHAAHPEIIKPRAGKQGLNLVRLSLLGAAESAGKRP